MFRALSTLVVGLELVKYLNIIHVFAGSQQLTAPSTACFCKPTKSKYFYIFFKSCRKPSHNYLRKGFDIKLYMYLMLVEVVGRFLVSYF